MRSWTHVFGIGSIVLALSAVGCTSTASEDAPSPDMTTAQPSGSPASPSPGEEPSPEPDALVIEATVRGGQVQTADERVDVAVGATVRLVIVADIDDELHVHGYELKRPITAGETLVLEFVADIPGVFEVELEEAGLELFELRVG